MNTQISSIDVSALSKCQTTKAQSLCIYDIGYKLKSPGQYDIGGTYSEDEPHLWFFYVTSACPGYNYLLNLFVCHRKTGAVSIGISDGNKLEQNNVGSTVNYVLPNTLAWEVFKAEQCNENSFIKTFCFNEADMLKMEKNCLVIPVTVQINTKCLLPGDVMYMMKLQHDFGDLLKNQERTDLVLNTPNQKQYRVHRIVLAVHSPVLREIIKNLKDESMFIDIDDNDIELLLEFLYTGTIKNICTQKFIQLMKIAHQFQIKDFENFQLSSAVLNKIINVNNALDFAVISENYKLQEIQVNVFNFIKNHPKILKSVKWEKFSDKNLRKKILDHISEDVGRDQSIT